MNEWLASLIVGVPALAISILALIYARRSADSSGASAIEAKRSADAAAEVAAYDRDRRHEERQPQIVPSFQPAGTKSGHHELRLIHNGGTPCEKVEVTLEKPGGYVQAIAGFSHSEAPWIIAPFQVGDEHGITVQEPHREGNKVIVHCLCTAGDKTWDLRIPLDIPSHS